MNFINNFFSRFSVTQASNYAAALGALLAILKINIGTEELTQIISAILLIGGIVTNWINRYMKGDLNIVGGRI